MLHIRALVKADTVILFDTYGSTETRLHSIFLYHLEVRGLSIILLIKAAIISASPTTEESWPIVASNTAATSSRRAHFYFALAICLA